MGPQPLELMRKGHLAKYRLFAAPKMISSAGVKITKTGDYDHDEMEAKLHEVMGEIIPDWKRFNPERFRTITVTPSVKTAYIVAGLFDETALAPPRLMAQ